jgi:hypothetical protein
MNFHVPPLQGHKQVMLVPWILRQGLSYVNQACGFLPVSQVAGIRGVGYHTRHCLLVL